MRKSFLIPLLFLLGVLVSCGNSQTNAELKDPAEVHPPTEAIPDSTKIVNDSVIVPDVSGDTSLQNNRDTARRNP